MLALPAAAEVTKTELAGNPLAQYPFFEYVRAFNVNAPVNVAIDPSRFPSIAGHTCNIYVVNHKTPSEWAANATLTDVTPGGALNASFTAGTIQANTFQVAAANDLNANAGTGLGVPYDVVIDVDNNGMLSDGDFIDGLGGEAGFYVVADTTAPGPLAVTEDVYNLDSGVASSFGIPGGFEGEDLYFPTNIAAMGQLPLVMLGHGNGHNFQWYDHIGNHLASYGYIVVSLANNTGPGPDSAATTELGHTDAFLDQSQAGAIAGGALVGHVDSHRIVLLGHSRGAEAVAISYRRIFDGSFTPMHFARSDIRLVDSMLPTDFGGTDDVNPHDSNYHLWTASGDSDVNGSAGDECGNTELCQTFHLLDRASHYRQGTIVQGAGHGDFHDEPVGDTVDEFFTGPCALGRHLTHLIQLGYMLPLVKHYVEGNIPALDFLTRQYESFHPIGVDTSNPCVVVTLEYHNGAPGGNFVLDDFQTQPSANTSSSGGSVTFDVDNLTEGALNDNNNDFNWDPSDPFNGATQAGSSDSLPTTRHDDSRGVVFDWTNAAKFIEWQVPGLANDFTQFRFFSFRAAQGTRHPNTVADLGDLTFTVTLRDGNGVTSSINIGAYGGGIEEPYQREGGWHNEMETVHIRTTDFLNNASGINLANIVAVRFNFGPASGSSRGRLVVDDLMLTNDLSPLTMQIIEPTTAHPRFAGTSVEGNRVLVRIVSGGGLDLSAANLTLAIDGTALTPAQIPTPATPVGAETWVVINAGPKPNGCHDLTATLTTPAGVSAAQPQSLCWADDESRTFDRVLAIDQTNSMNYDSRTNVSSSAKIDAARAGAKFFIDLSNPNDKIGVISFQRRDQNHDGTITDPDELAEPKFAIVPAGEGATDQRPAARAAIDGIMPDTSPGFSGPETSVGAGMVEARAMITGGAVAGHEPNIVLLTDGLENYPPYWTQAGPGGPLKPVFMADNVRVDTVGVGLDADDVLLEDIAATTGGEFRHLNEGTGSFFLLSRMADWYKSVDEDIRGEQRFFYAEGFPPESIVLGDRKLRVGTFDVEPALDWMTVAFHSDIDNAATVTLFPPGGGPAIVAAPPNITVRTEPKHSVYRIRTPAPGRWSYAVNVHDSAAEFFAVASAPTALTARVGPNQLARRPSGDYVMPLRVWIADRGEVRGATVSGYVRRPDGVHDPVTLTDGGASMDGGANDGIYGLPYVATLPGAYYVSLKASGTSNTGEPFERYVSTAFVLPGAPHRPLPPGEGGPTVPGGNLNPKGCNCDAESRYSISYFGGVTVPHGTFNTIADPSFSLGIRPAVHLPALGSHGSLGLYLGYDNFHNSGAGGDFHLEHLSPEIEIAPWTRFCPLPTIHLGVGMYRDESGTMKPGWNVGVGLSVCLARRHLSFVPRYDYRSVHGLSRDYSTFQLGLKFSF
jgi:hypothetical protein